MQTPAQPQFAHSVIPKKGLTQGQALLSCLPLNVLRVLHLLS